MEEIERIREEANALALDVNNFHECLTLNYGAEKACDHCPFSRKNRSCLGGLLLAACDNAVKQIDKKARNDKLGH